MKAARRAIEDIAKRFGLSDAYPAQVVSENPQLYFEIQQGTVMNATARAAFTEALDELVASISEGDEGTFVEMMNRANAHVSAGNGET